jgi:hypothetical protein
MANTRNLSFLFAQKTKRKNIKIVSSVNENQEDKERFKKQGIHNQQESNIATINLFFELHHSCPKDRKIYCLLVRIKVSPHVVSPKPNKKNQI